MSNTPDLSGYLSPSEAARRLGVSVMFVRWLAKNGRLPVLVTPNGRLFHERDVEAMAVARRNRGARSSRLPD